MQEWTRGIIFINAKNDSKEQRSETLASRSYYLLLAKSEFE